MMLWDDWDLTPWFLAYLLAIAVTLVPAYLVVRRIGGRSRLNAGALAVLIALVVPVLLLYAWTIIVGPLG